MRALLLIILLSLFGCADGSVSPETTTQQNIAKSDISLVILGTVQDAGAPHIACTKACCALLFNHPDPTKKVVALGVVDHEADQTFLFEATPDITTQVKYLSEWSQSDTQLPDGIFLTHAHIGHYSGLMFLGREATNAREVPVYAMPKMEEFLSSNGPWNQLVQLNNIKIEPLQANKVVNLSTQLKVTPFLVPHRDEYSETVGYRIDGPNKSVLFIPDIDKWEKWDQSITALLAEVDYAFVDATFYSGAEINSRDISEIPHPFIIESMELFEDLDASEREKIHFIHFNHTNPVLNSNSTETQNVLAKGYHIAQFGDEFSL